MLTPPFLRAMAAADKVLLVGMGGGFDIYTGLPIYFALQAAGKQVALANISFASIYASTGKQVGPSIVEVTSRTQTSELYFPELFLARWLDSVGRPQPVYCLDRVGVKPLTQAYRWLVERFEPDAVVLVDGGTDSLMRGDEPSLATPQEDAASIAAAWQTVAPGRGYLTCIGFGVDTFHGVCHHYFLEAVAALTATNGFLGAWSLTREMPEVTLYGDAVEFARREMRNHPSIVSHSVLAAIDGRFGDYHATSRTEGSELYVNPLMAMYWAFRLEAVAERNLYLPQIMATKSYSDVSLAIERFRDDAHGKQRSWRSIPL